VRRVKWGRFWGGLVASSVFLELGQMEKRVSNEAKWLGQVLVCLWRCVVCSWIGVYEGLLVK